MIEQGTTKENVIHYFKDMGLTFNQAQHIYSQAVKKNPFATAVGVVAGHAASKLLKLNPKNITPKISDRWYRDAAWKLLNYQYSTYRKMSMFDLERLDRIQSETGMPVSQSDKDFILNLRGLKKRKKKNPQVVQHYLGIYKSSPGVGRIFVSAVTPTPKLYPLYRQVVGPKTIEDLFEYAEYMGVKIKNPMKKKNPPPGYTNPPERLPKGAVEIYDQIESIEAIKGKNSLWPGEPFRHNFAKKSKAKIYGLPDGSLLIKGKKKLHKNFNYPGMERKK